MLVAASDCREIAASIKAVAETFACAWLVGVEGAGEDGYDSGAANDERDM